VLLIISLYFNYQINLKIKTIQDKTKKSDNSANPAPNEDSVEDFIKKVINLASKIPQNPVSESIINQLIKTVTSIGSILIWTKNPKSRRDFQYKIGICLKKVQETEYWLKMVFFFSLN